MNFEVNHEQQNEKTSTSRSGESLFGKLKNLFGKEDNDKQELANADLEKNKESDGTINKSKEEQHNLTISINAPEQATKDPFAYAREQIADKRNREHGVDIA